MRYDMIQQANGKYMIVDQWCIKVLVSDASYDYCMGYLAGLANFGGK